jgi:hypothetical protein
MLSQRPPCVGGLSETCGPTKQDRSLAVLLGVLAYTRVTDFAWLGRLVLACGCGNSDLESGVVLGLRAGYE